jgi:5-methylcytosine-specific restriction endonuclease McrA
MQAALGDSRTESTVTDDAKRDLSIAELDQRLEQAVEENERSERLICDLLLAMVERRGYEKFGFTDIYYYAEGRFGFSARKTRYLLHLAQQLRRLPRVKEALAQGRLGWTKASRIARVATTEDEVMWLDSALSLSVRELDQKINAERDAAGVKIRAWLTQDQAAVWDYALEVCRRVNGVDLDVGHCLELIAGEFLATYAYRAHQLEETECSDEGTLAEEQHAAEDGPSDEEAAALEQKICPCNDDLPCPTASAEYGRTWRFVLERDAYRCQYPDCAARRELHVHHIVFRSHSGKKGRARSNSPQNLITTCVFHHRMIHAGTIGVKGQAPSGLIWRRPAIMEKALTGFDSGRVAGGGGFAREPHPVYGRRAMGKGVRVWQTFAKTVSEGNRAPVSSVFRPIRDPAGINPARRGSFLAFGRQ